jgi:hypothetical protein
LDRREEWFLPVVVENGHAGREKGITTVSIYTSIIKRFFGNSGKGK